MREALLCDAIRTPIGRYGGMLSAVRSDDLAAIPVTNERRPTDGRKSRDTHEGPEAFAISQFGPCGGSRSVNDAPDPRGEIGRLLSRRGTGHGPRYRCWHVLAQG